jgi:hypothetical protein
MPLIRTLVSEGDASTNRRGLYRLNSSATSVRGVSTN